MFIDDPFFLIGILMAALIPLYIFILKKLRPSQAVTKTSTMHTSNGHNFKTKKKNMRWGKKTQKNTLPEKPKHVCAHSFGFLRALPKNASIPAECLGCARIVECLTHE
jgi:hypothetical protein